MSVNSWADNERKEAAEKLADCISKLKEVTDTLNEIQEKPDMGFNEYREEYKTWLAQTEVQLTEIRTTLRSIVRKLE